MKDEDIERLLRAWPRQKASPDFTARLLEKLDQPPTKSASALSVRGWKQPLLAGAAALALLGALASGLRHWNEARERAEAVRRIEALRSQYEVLEQELAELRSLAAASQPVLELGGTEDLDILVDLRDWAPEARQVRTTGRAEPVDYRP